jgi:hypothetical protein
MCEGHRALEREQVGTLPKPPVAEAMAAESILAGDQEIIAVAEGLETALKEETLETPRTRGLIRRLVSRVFGK